MSEPKQRLWILARSAFFTIVMPGTILYYVPRTAHAFQDPRGGAWVGVAAVPAVLGCALLLYCVFEFAWVGMGTLAPIDPPRNLVQRGPYRYVRNPMYLGVFGVLVGEMLAFRSRVFPLFGLAVLVCVNLFVRFYEEPMLRRKFGDSYARYCAAVPRWIPRLPK